MRKLVALVIASMLSFSVSATQGGENVSISLDGTGISTIDYEEVVPASSRGSYEIRLEVDDESNISSIRWVTQVCINSGVCYPPEEVLMELSESGTSFVGLHQTEPGYSYMSWKFILESDDGSESQVPEVGFGWKVWSDCWFDNGTWGGSETSCQEDKSVLPGFAISLTMASVAMAALMAKRD